MDALDWTGNGENFDAVKSKNDMERKEEREGMSLPFLLAKTAKRCGWVTV